jgi:hypothetical protein
MADDFTVKPVLKSSLKYPKRSKSLKELEKLVSATPLKLTQECKYCRHRNLGI